MVIVGTKEVPTRAKWTLLVRDGGVGLLKRSEGLRKRASDVTGVFCTSGSEREFTLEGSWYADEEIQAGTDRDVVAAG
jgi:hypothetical protein